MMKSKWFQRIGSFTLAFALLLGCGTVNAKDIANCTEGQKCVVDSEKKVTLTIHKYEMESIKDLNTANGDGSELKENKDLPDQAKPLADVTFAVYKVDADTTSLEIPKDVVAAGEKTTGTDGTAKFTELSQGRYLVVETKVPDKVYEKCENFLVDLPMMNAKGDAWNYNVHAYPKNGAVIGAVILTKQDTDTSEVLAGAKFKLQQKQNDIYVDMKDSNGALREFETGKDGKIIVNGLFYGDYQFIETKAPQGYGINKKPVCFQIIKNAAVDEKGKESGSVVKVSAEDVKTPTIEKEANKESASIGDLITWTLTPTVPSDIDSYKEYEVSDAFDSRLTYEENSLEVFLGGEKMKSGYKSDIVQSTPEKKGMIKVTFDNFKSLKGKRLEIKFDTEVNSLAGDKPGFISNKGNISYENASQTTGKVESNEVKVYVGNICVVKYEAGNEKNVLKDAQFAIYKSKEAAVKGTEQIGETVKTDESGKAYFKGFAAGDYWIVEKVSPTYQENQTTKHYLLMTSPEKVTVSKNDKDGVVTIKIANKKQGFTIPKTGGAGTVIFLFAGLMLASGSVILLILRKKRVEV